MSEHIKDLVITRTFEAPLELVWRAWSEPEHLMQWWGPNGFVSPSCAIDFQVGGKYLFCMQSPDGQRMWSTGVYKEIEPMKKIVCTDSFSDEYGNVSPASANGMPEGSPDECLVTITFKESHGKTTMILHHNGLPEGEMQESARAGWNESLDKLDKSLFE